MRHATKIERKNIFLRILLCVYVESLETVTTLKSKLIASEKLLSYNREDLFKPWMDSVEEKQKIKILDKM